MSGGSLNYICYTLEDHVGDFKDKELDQLVKDLADLFHSREWYLSGDTNEGNWREARDAFKEKWFTQHGRQERIEQYLADIRKEVLEMFGMSKEYCQYCKHWTPGKDDSPYGDCEFQKCCMSHRSESCDRFDKKEDEE